MSLIHWWPLNGDIQDKIQGVTLTNTNATLTTAKIGQGYSFDGTSGSCLSQTYNQTIPTDKFSFAFWIRLDSSWTGWGQVFTVGIKGTSWTHIRIGIDVRTDRNAYFSVSNGSSSVSTSGPYHNLAVDTWHHIICIYDNGSMAMYVDGSAATGRATATTTIVPLLSSASIISIGGNSSEVGECTMCDVRVYDHALSIAEVKELSKGLLVHYSFNDKLGESTTNLVSNLKAGGRTTVDNTAGVVTTGGLDQDTYFYLVLSEALVAGETYTIQCIGENIPEGEYWTFGMSGQTGTDPKFNIYNGYNEFTFVATEKNAASTSVLFDDTFRTNVWSNQCKFSMFQLEKKDHATFYTKTSRESMMVDESGYDHPITLVNNCTFTSDTKKGTLALRTAGASNTASFSACSYLKSDIGASLTPTAFTICTIAKVNTWGKQTSGIISLSTAANDPTDYQGSTLAQYDGKFQLNASGVTTGYSLSTGVIELGAWHHYSFVWDGSTWKSYRDGTLYQSIAAEITPDPFRYIYLGVNRAGGATRDADVTWADFKIYTTALSAEDIEIKATSRALITDQGDMLCHEFIEDVESLVKENYTTHSNSFQELEHGDFEFIEYIESTGTQYIDTDYYWTSEKATIVADIMVTSNSSNQTLFGNEERYSGSSRYFAHIFHGSNGSYSNYIGTGATGTSTSLPLNNRYVVEYIANGDKTFTTCRTDTSGTVTTFNKNKAYSGTIMTKANTTSTTSNAGNIFIFSNHNGYNGTGAIQNVGGMRVYRFTMYDNDKCVRDFIPCKRKSDSGIGLFDIVTGEFYTSPNGVAFTAGSTVSLGATARFLIGGAIQARTLIET